MNRSSVGIVHIVGASRMLSCIDSVILNPTHCYKMGSKNRQDDISYCSSLPPKKKHEKRNANPDLTH